MAATVVATIMAGDMARALDPALLANAAGIEPDDWQADLLRSGAKQIILNCSRQVGKSTICSILALHDVLYMPPALVLVLSPSQRQSAELFNKIKKSYFKVTGGAARQDSATSLELNNGSRIVSLPGNSDTIRGFSGVSRLIVDEAAKVPDQLYQAVRPMLAVSSGSIALLSSPFGKRGFFHHEWSEGDGWQRYEIPATQCPRIDPAWLAAERKAIGEFWYQQEYCGAFLEAQDSVFRFEDIQSMFDTDAKPMFAQEQAIYHPAGSDAGDEEGYL